MTALVTQGDTKGQKTAAERFLPAFSLAPLIGSSASGAFLYWILVLVGIAATVSALGFLEVRRRKSAGVAERRHAVVFSQGRLPLLARRTRKRIT